MTDFDDVANVMIENYFSNIESNLKSIIICHRETFELFEKLFNQSRKIKYLREATKFLFDTFFYKSTLIKISLHLFATEIYLNYFYINDLNDYSKAENFDSILFEEELTKIFTRLSEINNFGKIGTHTENYSHEMEKIIETFKKYQIEAESKLKAKRLSLPSKMWSKMKKFLFGSKMENVKIVDRESMDDTFNQIIKNIQNLMVYSVTFLKT